MLGKSFKPASIAAHDSVGSNVYHHTFEHQVMRTVPKENEAVNECWLSDRDRFSYEGLYTEERLEYPMLKKQGEWQVVSWDEALDATAKVLKACNKDQAAVLASPNATLEELYLLQKSMRAIGINNIEHRLRQCDFSGQDAAPLSPQLNIDLDSLETQQAVLLIGSNIRYEQPMANHRLRKASLQGAQVMTLNPYQIEFNYDTAEQCVSTPAEMLTNLAAVAIACGVTLTHFADVTVNTQIQTIADNLNKADKAILLLGNLATQHPAYANLCALAHLIAEQTGATLGYLPEAANTVGAWLAGVVPHRKEAGLAVDQVGLSGQQILSADTKTFVLLGVEAEFDCDNPQQSLAALSQADHVIAINSYVNSTLKSRATILLPASQTVETSGTLVNMEGRFQSFTGVSKLPKDVRPTWKILRVLGNILDIKGFDYMSSEEVCDEVKAAIAAAPQHRSAPFSEPKAPVQEKAHGLQRIGAVQMYSGDSLVRRAAALQRAASDECRKVSLHPHDIAALNLHTDEAVSVSQGDSSVRMHLVADTAIPIGSVLIPAATQKSTELGAAFGIVHITKG